MKKPTTKGTIDISHIKMKQMKNRENRMLSRKFIKVVIEFQTKTEHPIHCICIESFTVHFIKNDRS